MFDFLKQPKSPPPACVDGSFRSRTDAALKRAEQHFGPEQQPTLAQILVLYPVEPPAAGPAAATLSPSALCDSDLIGAIHYVHIQYLTGRHSYFMPIMVTRSCRSLLSLLAEVIQSGVEPPPSFAAVAPGSRWNELCKCSCSPLGECMMG